ncbi:MAG: M3 family oligoendopeptidase [Anaerolineae bacterium]|nr:M3 family oligoendopeptidase [Caldilineales bacterium]MDW8269912.1 M3 family oligoendopeptidase [Anaerolineae bacterium]
MSTYLTSPTTWSLDDLFPAATGPDIEQAFAELEREVGRFEQVRDQLEPNIPIETLAGIIQHLEQINRLAYRLYAFAGLRFAADTQDQTAQTLLARVQQFMARLSNRTLFFSLWWKGLDDAEADRLLAGIDAHTPAPVSYWLEEMRHFKPHTLSEPEEKIINLKNVTGMAALHTLYDAITNRYVFKVAVNGVEKEMTRGELMTLVRSPDPDLRARAYEEQLRVYGQDGPILGQMYQTLVRDWYNEQVELRRFASPMAARNLQNDIPDEVVDTLLAVAEANAPVFQRFFRLKARLLGMERLRRYDIYAPVATTAKKTYSFAEATGMVLEAFAEFDPQIAELARRVFAERRVDAEVRKGKRSGAFCWSVTPDLTPWVLLNYQGEANDVATMAHELGHAIHSLLASHHSLFTFHASLPLAETASTFGEMLLIDRLLVEEQDPAVRRDILFRQVDDAYATIMRQAFFALFERQAHDMVQANASVDDLAAAYLDNLRAQFGDSVSLSDSFRWEWVSIPHIYHTPFYVYAYAFGQLLVLALYRRYQQEGETFKPRYLGILAAGGSNAPIRILDAAGVDIRRREFWQGGFDIIAELIDQLETL